MNIVDKIEAAGIVGCGGAGFPTHIKMSGSPSHLIVNGAECEPLICTDRYIMRHHAEDIVCAAEVLGIEMNVEKCTIVLKENYTEEINALEKAIEKLHAKVSLHLLDSYYPAGDEQSIVYEVTGNVVPPSGIPLDVGCVVSNASTMFAVRAAMEGSPMTDKYVTVNGAANQPSIVKAPLGTSISECIDACGGVTLSEYAVLIGGPMMGKIIPYRQAKQTVVNKTTSGIIILPIDHSLVQDSNKSTEWIVKQARVACIRCSQCSDICPRHLLGHPITPHKIMRSFALCGNIYEVAESEVGKLAAICCECGLCEVVACPMGLKPRRINREIKQVLASKGYRYPKNAGQLEVNPWREHRMVSSSRAAARVGVSQYERKVINDLLEVHTDYVRLSLNQHIGSPSIPVVQVGDYVRKGQLIAICQEGKLGAKLHASIDGFVESIEEMNIVLRGGDFI